MEMDKQGMHVMMRGKGEHKGWTIWIHKQNFGRVGVVYLTGMEKVMVFVGG